MLFRSVCIRWPKYWSLSFNLSLSPFNECLGLISFRIDWFDLLAVQRTLKSLFQYRSSKASILLSSAFFIVQLFLYSPTLASIYDYWKNHSFDSTDLCWQSNVSAFSYAVYVITFLPRSNCLLISRVQSPSAVILEPKKRNSVLFPLFPHLFATK